MRHRDRRGFIDHLGIYGLEIERIGVLYGGLRSPQADATIVL